MDSRSSLGTRVQWNLQRPEFMAFSLLYSISRKNVFYLLTKSILNYVAWHSYPKNSNSSLYKKQRPQLCQVGNTQTREKTEQTHSQNIHSLWLVHTFGFDETCCWNTKFVCVRLVRLDYYNTINKEMWGRFAISSCSWYFVNV